MNEKKIISDKRVDSMNELIGLYKDMWNDNSKDKNDRPKISIMKNIIDRFLIAKKDYVIINRENISGTSSGTGENRYKNLKKFLSENDLKKWLTCIKNGPKIDKKILMDDKRVEYLWKNSEKFQRESYGNAVKEILDYKDGEMKFWILGGKLDGETPPSANLEILRRVQWKGRGRFAGTSWKNIKGTGKYKSWRNVEYWELNSSPHQLTFFNKALNLKLLKEFLMKRTWKPKIKVK